MIRVSQSARTAPLPIRVPSPESRYNRPLSPMHFLDKLNPEQREAALHLEGPLLILAGAGSGKTRVITYRIAYIIGDGHAEPDQVLAVTFTNKAAQEMRERVTTLIGDDAKSVWLSTFHALCARLLRREAPKIGLSRDFVIYDSSDQVAVVKQALRELNIAPELVPPRMALSRISHAKNRMEGPDSLRGQWNLRDEQIAKVFEKYIDRAEGQQRARLRRSAAQDRGALRDVRADSELLLAQVPLRDGRRVPGHQPAAVPADPRPRRGAPQPGGRRRSRSVDLQVARRRPAQHPRLRARLRRSAHRPARAELPFDPDHPGRRVRGDQPEPQPQGQAALDRSQGRLAHPLLPRQRRARGGRLHRPHGEAGARRRRRGDGRGALSHQLAVARDRRLADARGRALQDHRRRPVLRAQGDQGRARLHEAGDQPARRREPAAGDQRAGARHRQGRDGLACRRSIQTRCLADAPPLLAAGLQEIASARSLWAKLVYVVDEGKVTPRAATALRSFRDMLVALAHDRPAGAGVDHHRQDARPAPAT